MGFPRGFHLGAHLVSGETAGELAADSFGAEFGVPVLRAYGEAFTKPGVGFTAQAVVLQIDGDAAADGLEGRIACDGDDMKHILRHGTVFVLIESNHGSEDTASRRSVLDSAADDIEAGTGADRLC